MTTDKTLSNLKRRLEKAELEHLRNHASDLAQRLEMMEERAEHAEEQVEWYWDEHSRLIDSLTDQDKEIGLTIDGRIGVIAPPKAAPCAIGEQWPGTDALYAGISLSRDNTHAVHLLLWPETTAERMNHATATTTAAAVSHEHSSALPTRTQAITLYSNLRDCFDKNPWYWTSTKHDGGDWAFIQDFTRGFQYYDGLSAECRVRAVSEIPL